MSLQDNWTVDRDLLHDKIGKLIARKERFANSEFNDPLVIATFSRQIFGLAQELVSLHEKYDVNRYNLYFKDYGD